jgi:glycosyltransferase involved in cell wall biosynthesis
MVAISGSCFGGDGRSLVCDVTAERLLLKKVFVIRERFSHMGGYSGYDMITSALMDNGLDVQSVWLTRLPWHAVTKKLVQYALRKTKHSPFYGRDNLWAELRMWLRKGISGRIIHILYGENNYGLFASLPKKPNSKLVVTLHQPYSWWLDSGLDLQAFFSKVDALIVLSSSELALFSEILGEKVHFVPHGIDTDFFHPMDISKVDSVASQAPQRCLVVGHWMRDFETLIEVVNRFVADNSKVCFDLVVPDMSARASDVEDRLQSLCTHQQVSRYVGIDDLELRDLYQNANLLFLPLRESTANNAILEAMGCGLPIVTNHTGGVADYIDDDFSRVCPPGDYDSMRVAINDILSDATLQTQMKKAARQHAEKDFSWNIVGRKLMNVYASLDSSQ